MAVPCSIWRVRLFSLNKTLRPCDLEAVSEMQLQISSLITTFFLISVSLDNSLLPPPPPCSKCRSFRDKHHNNTAFLLLIGGRFLCCKHFATKLGETPCRSTHTPIPNLHSKSLCAGVRKPNHKGDRRTLAFDAACCIMEIYLGAANHISLPFAEILCVPSAGSILSGCQLHKRSQLPAYCLCVPICSGSSSGQVQVYNETIFIKLA